MNLLLWRLFYLPIGYQYRIVPNQCLFVEEQLRFKRIKSIIFMYVGHLAPILLARTQ